LAYKIHHSKNAFIDCEIDGNTIIAVLSPHAYEVCLSSSGLMLFMRLGGKYAVKTTNPKSNTWIVVVPITLWFVAWFFYVQYIQEATHGRYDSLMASGISLPFFSTAIAQLRSGYLWKNLAPGNRGEHRDVSPKQFTLSTIGHVVIGTILVALFSCQYWNQNEQAVAPNRSLPPFLNSTSSLRGSED
jgi:hypothetical protein